MRSFLATPEQAEAELWFCPELLGTTYSYARQFWDEEGALREETDRWQEAHELVALGRECFLQAGGQEETVPFGQNPAVSALRERNEG